MQITVSPVVTLSSSQAFIPGNNFKHLCSEANLSYVSEIMFDGQTNSKTFQEDTFLTRCIFLLSEQEDFVLCSEEGVALLWLGPSSCWVLLLGKAPAAVPASWRGCLMAGGECCRAGCGQKGPLLAPLLAFASIRNRGALPPGSRKNK